MSKGTRWIKRKIALLLVLLLSIESFGAIVSDNDGSAFITKAEFDSLKNDFQAQIDSYNTSIDSKIDGAIAAYLAGIRISTRETIVNANKVDSSEKDAFKFIKFLEKDELEASHVETYYDVSFECIKFSGSSKWDSDNIITHPKTWTSDYELAVIFAKTADPIQLKNNWNTYYDSAAARLWFCNSFLLSELTTIAKDNRCKPFYNVASQSVLTKVPYITKDGYVESWGQKALKGNFTALYEAARWGGIDSQRFHMYLDETLPMNTLKNVLYAEWNGRNARTGNILTDKVMTSKSINREQELKLLGVGSWKDGVSPEGTAGAGVYQPARFGGVSFSIVEAEKPKDKGLYIVSSVDDENDVKLNYIQENADVKADTYEYKDKTDNEWYDQNKWCYINIEGQRTRKSANGNYSMSAELTLPIVCSYNSSITKWTDLKDKHLKLDSNEGRLYEGIAMLKLERDGKLEFSLRITNDNEDNKNKEYYVYINEGAFTKNQSDFSKCVKVTPTKVKKDVITTIKFDVKKGKEYFMFIKGVEDDKYNGAINYFSDYVFEGE